MLMVVISSVAQTTSATPIDDLRAWINGNVKAMSILSWAGGQPIVLTNAQTGVSYDIYLTNTGFDECYNQFNSAVYQVIEVHPRGANYGTSHAVAISCQKGLTSANAREVEMSIGQQLVNGLAPATPTPTPSITTGTPTPTPTTGGGSPAPKPQIIPPNIDRLFSAIWGSIKSIFGLSISGGATIVTPVNQAYTATVSLPFTAPDKDWTDGKYQTVYAEWFIADSVQTVKAESGWIEVSTTPYTGTISFTPTAPGKYYVVGLVVKQDYTWDNTAQKWNVVETVESKEVQQITATPSTAPTTTRPSLSSFLSGLMSFLRSLFPW